MAAAFGVALNSVSCNNIINFFNQTFLQAIKSGSINVKFEGVGLGDGWISPLG